MLRHFITVLLQTNFLTKLVGCILINYQGGLQKIICDKNIGVFSEPGNVSGFANEIINLFNDKDKLKFFGKNSRKLTEESFSKNA